MKAWEQETERLVTTKHPTIPDPPKLTRPSQLVASSDDFSLL